MKDLLLLILTIICFQNFSLAQCDTPEPPAINYCNLAPLFCGGIDGYCSTLSTEDSVAVFLGCNASVFNNTDWISFVAGTDSISILITLENCQGAANGQTGAQAAIYKNCPFDQDILALQCGCAEDSIYLSSDAFIVGERYFLAVDGCAADICDYEISVIEGNTMVEEFTGQTGTILGEDSFCTGDIAIFTTEEVNNAHLYTWSAGPNASIISGQGSSEIAVVIEGAGDIEICVTAGNLCYSAEQNCITVSSMFESQNYIQFDTICEGESVFFQGEEYTETGYYSAVYTNANGCDSTYNLDLLVHPDISIIEMASICEGESYSIGDSTYTETGNYLYTDLTPFGCDFIVYLELEVLAEYETFIEDSICAGEPYPFGGGVVIGPGEYAAVLQSTGGCDSTVYLTLNEKIVPEIDIEASICAGEVYNYANYSFSQSGEYDLIISGNTTCDSVVHLSLEVIPTYVTTIDALLEPGEPYDGQIFENDTTLIDSLLTMDGCDSIVVVNIEVSIVNIQLLSGIDQLSVFPNPANDRFYIKVSFREAINIRFDLYNTLGQRLERFSGQGHYPEGQHVFEASARTLTNGTYFLHFQTSRGSMSKKVVVFR